MKTIALIIPYIGKCRNFFPLFLESCKNNSSIDFFFFSDCMEEFEKRNLSKNIKFIKMTLDELKQRAQRCFGFDILLEYPYKLYDYKPVYGQMFVDYICNYDYWGHVDEDLILGNLRSFLDPLIEKNKFGRLLQSGHLTIYHNDEWTNNIFREEHSDTMSYKEVYTNNGVYAFDEGPGTATIWLKYHRDKIFTDMTLMRDLYRWSKTLKDWHKLNGPLVYFNYNKGELTECSYTNGKCNENNVLYVHLYQRKMDVKVTNLDSFSIVPNKFIPYLGTNVSLGKRILLCWRPFYPEFYYARFKKKMKQYFLKFNRNN